MFVTYNRLKPTRDLTGIQTYTPLARRTSSLPKRGHREGPSYCQREAGRDSDPVFNNLSNFLLLTSNRENDA